MTIDDAFDVDAPLDKVWAVLKDVPRVATCIPNAQITDTVDDKTYRAKVSVKVGPISVTYKATIVMTSIDDDAHSATIDIKGDDITGRGGVKATVVTGASAVDGKTHVTLHTDAQVSGMIASIGGRLIEGVAKKTIAQFAENLAAIV
jgi:carbon monoxide dehydrogenase subunit G